MIAKLFCVRHVPAIRRWNAKSASGTCGSRITRQHHTVGFQARRVRRVHLHMTKHI